MSFSKKDIPCYVVLGLFVIGFIAELIGGLISGQESVGFNFSLSALMIVGIVLIAVCCIAHIVIKVLQNKIGCSANLLDVEAIVAIVMAFFAIIYLVCVIIWPVVFPANG
ncbi:MAG TPA: hypothetical protein DDY77_03345 [Clostridiales bacterium]|mgnify:CR=1 FL=1|nr:hypothetical protein [Clostridiales bacterium]